MCEGEWEPEFKPFVDMWYRKTKKSAFNLKVLVAALVFTFFLAVWPAITSALGRRHARSDVAAGRYVIDTHGYPAAGHHEYVQLLRERYHVEIRHHGCVIGMAEMPLMDYSMAYNSEVRTAAMQKFGHDIFAECSAAVKNRLVTKTSP